MLKYLGSGEKKSINDLNSHLASLFKLSEGEKKELFPNGKQPIFYNRVGWARTYLKKAGLVDSPERGKVVITKSGLELLKTDPPSVTVKMLNKYPGFIEYHRLKKERIKNPEPELLSDGGTDKKSPEDVLVSTYTFMRETLAEELLQKVIEQPPDFFERMVIQLLVSMGYGGSFEDAGKAIGKSGDEGIDGVIKEDRLGLDVIYVQAKRWARDVKVSRPEIQKFVGALAGQGAKKGIFLTTSSFSKEARDYVPKNETKIVLIDGEEMAQMMIDFNIGVFVSNSYEIKRIDADFFGDDN